MLRLEKAEYTRMAQTGSSLMRLIQNHDLPILDLLVRESIQNSLDASKSRKLQSYVDVHFNQGEFETESLANNLEGIGEGLVNRFGRTSQHFISIRDYNTVGLTGPLHHGDVKQGNFGNLLKLVYEISKPQEQTGSGGSWGLGKTVYYRVGIGLVFFYSRVKTKTGYESRLAACLVENEKEPGALLGGNSDLERGIAWWGQAYANNGTIPITNENIINEILAIFKVKPYKEKETGTTIIIPFVDPDALLREATHFDEEQHRKYAWSEDISQYLNLAVQRWYAPRLLNRYFPTGAYLRVFINDIMITQDDIYPVFLIIQALFNRASYHGRDEIPKFFDVISTSNLDMKVIDINIQRTFQHGQRAGHVAVSKLANQDLGMLPPRNYWDPYTYIGEANESMESNSPIITYTRRPGMLVNYEISGTWVGQIPRTENDEYIIGIFVPNLDNKLNEDLGAIDLDEYLRQSEQADHKSWSDFAINSKRIGIIDRVSKQIPRKIADAYRPHKDEKMGTRNRGLGKALAEILLPPEGYGRQSSLPHKKISRSGSRARKNKTRIWIDSPTYKQGNVCYPFELSFSSTNKQAILEVIALLENGSIRANRWEKADEIGTKFPLAISNVEIQKIAGKRGRPRMLNEFKVMTGKYNSVVKDGIKATLLTTKEHEVPYGLLLTTEDLGLTVSGMLEIRNFDPMIRAGINLREQEGEI